MDPFRRPVPLYCSVQWVPRIFGSTLVYACSPSPVPHDPRWECLIPLHTALACSDQHPRPVIGRDSAGGTVRRLVWPISLVGSDCGKGITWMVLPMHSRTHSWQVWHYRRGGPCRDQQRVCRATHGQRPATLGSAARSTASTVRSSSGLLSSVTAAATTYAAAPGSYRSTLSSHTTRATSHSRWRHCPTPRFPSPHWPSWPLAAAGFARWLCGKTLLDNHRGRRYWPSYASHPHLLLVRCLLPCWRTPDLGVPTHLLRQVPYMPRLPANRRQRSHCMAPIRHSPAACHPDSLEDLHCHACPAQG